MNRAMARRAVIAAAAACAGPARAHGFGQRFDLPLPLWLWLTGAGATIVLTFVVMALFVRERPIDTRPRQLDLLRFALPRMVARPWLPGLLRALVVALFVLTLCAGFYGNANPYSNLITPMVWVAWWVGVAFASALVGNVWTWLNPLRTVFLWAEALHARLAPRRTLSLGLPYPAWLGAWPAVLIFLGFAWAELIWEDKDVPSALASAITAYAVFSWIAMWLFGRELWLRSGEAFAVAFGVLAGFAPLAFAGGPRRLILRPLGAGLANPRPVSWSMMAFVLLMLSTVTFDGFQETALMQRIETDVQGVHAVAVLLFRLSDLGFDESRVVHTTMLVAFAAAFVAIFWATSWIMLRWTAACVGTPAIAGVPGASAAAEAFVLTLVPIAVAYHLSHYFSLLLTAGQFVIPLASDPFGFGWNLFGTAHYKVDLAIVSPYVFWYGAVFIIVLGHVIAVYLAHVAAWRVFGSHRAALVSQVPMLLLMVAYTTLSLWILAQPIVG